MILGAAVHYGYSIHKYDPLSLNLSSGVSEQANERSEQSVQCGAIQRVSKASERANERAEPSTLSRVQGWRTGGGSGGGDGGGAQ